MKLSVLTENTASEKFSAEHGLSYYIEHDVKILFDTGHSDIFLKNAQKLLRLNWMIKKKIMLLMIQDWLLNLIMKL